MRAVVVNTKELFENNPSLKMSPKYVISRVDKGELKDYSKTFSWKFKRFIRRFKWKIRN